MTKLKALDCPFCSALVAPRIFSARKYSFSILARHGVAPGQSLVIPKRHVETLEELEGHEVADLMLQVAESISMLRSAGVAKDFNVAINLGALAGQTVSHLHVHIIPRHERDAIEPKRWLSDALFEKLRERSDDELVDFCQEVRGLRSKSSRSLSGLDIDFLSGNGIGSDEFLDFKESVRYEDGFLCERLNISVGAGSLIRSGARIYRDVSIGANFECGHDVLVRDGSRIGNRVCVYTGAQIQKDVVIGDASIIGGWVGNSSYIGRDVKMFGELIHKYQTIHRGVKEPAPHICDGAFVGWNAIVIGGVNVGRQSVVGAGSVVTADVADASLVAGNPARPLNGGGV